MGRGGGGGEGGRSTHTPCKVGWGNLERRVTWNRKAYVLCAETGPIRARLRDGSWRYINALPYRML